MQKLFDVVAKNIWLIAGSFFSAAVVAHFLWRNNFKSRRAAACSAFRSAVLTALNGLYPYPVNWPSDGMAIHQVLGAAFPALQAAVVEFRQNVPWYKRRCFDRAWRIYRLGKDGRDIDYQDYWQYVPHSGEGIEQGRHYKHDNTRTYKDNFKKNVDRLLRYANKT